jgi:hypothetical protein
VKQNTKENNNTSNAIANQALQKKSDGVSLEPPLNILAITSNKKIENRSTKQAVVQKMYDKSKFMAETEGGVLVMRGGGVKDVDTLVDEYDKLQKNWSKGKKEDLVYLHEEIGKAIEGWLEFHKDETRQADRSKKFRDFLKGNYALEKDRLTMRGTPEEEKNLESSDFIKKRKANHEGSGDGLFKKLGEMVNAMVPNNGDSSALELAVKVPTGAGTLYVGGKIGLEAEKDEDNVKISAEVDLLLGGTVPGIAEITGSLGSYVEAEAASASEAIELMSYGLYQKARASKLCPDSLTNTIWGGGKSGSLGFAEAENKNAEREARIFKPLKEKRDKLTNEIAILSNQLQAGKAVLENIAKLKEKQADLAEVNEKIEHTSVETGEKVGIAADVGVGDVAKMSGEASAKKGTKIDLGAIEEAKGDQIGKAGKHGELAKIGKSVTGYELKASVEVGPGSAEIAYSRGYAEGKLDSSEIQVSGEFAIPVSNSVANAIIPPIVDLGARGAEFIRLRVLKSEEANNPSGSGVATNYIMGEALSFSSLQSSEGDLLSKIEKFDPDKKHDTLEGKVALKISIKGDFHKGGVSIELSYIKELGVDAGVFNGKQTKGQRLIKGEIGGGAVKWS